MKYQDVSFFIRTFSREESLETLVKTIIERCSKNVHSYIVDDSEITVSKIRKYALWEQHFPFKIIHPKDLNIGMSACFNLMFPQIKEPFVLFLSDNAILTNNSNILGLVEFLKTHPDYCAIGGGTPSFLNGVNLVKKDSVLSCVENKVRPNSEGSFRWRDVNLVSFDFVLIRKSVFTEFPLNRHIGDHSFFVDILDSPWKVAFSLNNSIDYSLKLECESFSKIWDREIHKHVLEYLKNRGITRFNRFFSDSISDHLLDKPKSSEMGTIPISVKCGCNPVHSFWMGSVLPNIVINCIKSFLDAGHTYCLYTYGPVSNVPQGVVVHDANEILLRSSLDRFEKFGVGPRVLSNIFRYFVLYRTGGWWVEPDVFCLKRFDIDSNYVFHFSSDKNNVVSTSVMKAPAGSDLVKELCVQARKTDLNSMKDPEYIGSKLITRILLGSRKYFVYRPSILPFHMFSPVDPKDLVSSKIAAIPEESLGVHLFQHILTGINTDNLFKSLASYQVLEKEESNISVMQREAIMVSMATIPERLSTMLEVVSCLHSQCDILNVYLNKYKEVPAALAKFSNVRYHLDPSPNNLRDAGKFYWSGEFVGFHLTVDDDIEYPSNYVKTLVKFVEEHKRRALVGVHGVVIYPQYGTRRNFYDFPKYSTIFGFDREVTRDLPVHILGTGTLAYHTDTIKYSWKDIQAPYGADDQLAIRAQDLLIPSVIIKRKENWLKNKPEVAAIRSMSACNEHVKARAMRIGGQKIWRLFFPIGDIIIELNHIDVLNMVADMKREWRIPEEVM